MTNDQINDCFSALGKAFAERRDLRKAQDERGRRLKAFSAALTALLENPLHAESLRVMNSASDPIEDWKALREGDLRLRELNKILAD